MANSPVCTAIRVPEAEIYAIDVSFAALPDKAEREYLNKHPREQYVALRIAEIYEENLNNPLAAALEYEEVLKKTMGQSAQVIFLSRQLN